MHLCPATVVSVTVCSVVLGAPFSSEMSFFFPFLSDVLFLPAVCLNGSVCLPAVAYSVTVGAEIKVPIPYVENTEL